MLKILTSWLWAQPRSNAFPLILTWHRIPGGEVWIQDGMGRTGATDDFHVPADQSSPGKKSLFIPIDRKPKHSPVRANRESDQKQMNTAAVNETQRVARWDVSPSPHLNHTLSSKRMNARWLHSYIHTHTTKKTHKRLFFSTHSHSWPGSYPDALRARPRQDISSRIWLQSNNCSDLLWRSETAGNCVYFSYLCVYVGRRGAEKIISLSGTDYLALQ